MLNSLHVKNLALIRETEVDFKNGLNILTGETGAGKSLIIGSLNLALGQRVSSSIISKGAEYALVELTFSISDEQAKQALAQLDIYPENGVIIISRKIYEGRSVCRINGETVNASTLKSAAEYLIDIHGQHEHQSLLYEKNHLSLLDQYGKSDLSDKLEKIEKLYKNYSVLKKKLDDEKLDDKEKNRDISILTHEVEQINAANLKPGEDEELERQYQKLSNSRKIMENLSSVYNFFSGENDNVSSAISRSIREISEISEYDENISQLENQLLDIEELIGDFSRGVSSYIDGFSFDESEFRDIEQRLDMINRFKERYGNTIEEILEYAAKSNEKLEKYSDYDAYIEKLEREFSEAESDLRALCEQVHQVRCDKALLLSEAIVKELSELNFDYPQFVVEVSATDKYSRSGFDNVRFLISLNAGEELKPLSAVASGGELSRIMLALKCVCADFGIETMIFDEIDTGISGKTADLVARKLADLSKSKQVFSITHLPQIAAFSDVHYLIEKSVAENVTSTSIHELISENEKIEEISRMLGGTMITDAVRENAKELRKLAKG